MNNKNINSNYEPRKKTASFASVLIDYDNYYHALHNSIVKAQKSIFLVGWDIDSRVELVRGVDAEHTSAPVTFYDLIVWKSEKDPHVQIYLNRWDFSMFFADKRELFSGKKWRKTGLNNIHFIMDGKTTMGGCHHQKIAVIDDEVAYSGGMDITRGRWDRRQHHVVNKFRDQAEPDEEVKETCPYHDVHTVFSGEIVKTLSDWTRERWEIASDIPLCQKNSAITDTMPATWPESVEPDFQDVNVAIARTLPHTYFMEQTEEILPLLLDEISQAENFIYIENQYLTNIDIANAIHKQMILQPKLRVVMISSYDPNGYFEKVAMWGGRMRFRQIIENEGLKDRVVLAYPMCEERDEVAKIRVHSKVLVIDDKILHVGSANMNNRSMGFDTECDVSIYASTENQKTKITDIRNDMIKEHTGLEFDQINTIVSGEKSLQTLIDNDRPSRQKLITIDDSEFQTKTMVKLITWLSDPRRPYLYKLRAKN